MATQAFITEKTKDLQRAVSAVRALTAGLQYECLSEGIDTCYPENNDLWRKAWEAMDELQAAIEQAKEACP